MQVNNSRSENAVRNFVVSTSAYIFYTVLAFILRRIFIHYLGLEYLGVNGLFTNVLTILSFAELGIGNAIIFSMYKPIKENDIEKLQSLLELFKRAYTLIGIAVLVFGMVLMPFLPYLINGKANISESIYFIYFLFLINTSASYFYSYRKAIISACQQEYINSICLEVSRSLQIILQGIVLIISRDFILYLVIQIFCTLINNFSVSYIAKRKFPWIVARDVKELSRSEKKSIVNDVKALVLYKFGSVILNGTDNILLSSLVGVTAVGLCSNYIMLVTTATTALTYFSHSFTAGIGNLNVSASNEKKEFVLRSLFMLSAWLYGFVSLGIYYFADDFITIAFGPGLLVDRFTLLAIVLHFYVNCVHCVAYTYRTTMGLFKEGRYAPLIAAFVNIASSILFYNWIGVCGIFFATAFSRFFTMGIFDPVLIYKRFKMSAIRYYSRYFLYMSILILAGFLSAAIIQMIIITGLFGFLLKLAIFTIIFNCIVLCLAFKTQEFEYLKEALFRVGNGFLQKVVR